MFILSQEEEEIIETTGKNIFVVGSCIYASRFTEAIGEYENEDHAKWVLTDIMQCKADGYEIYYMPSSEAVATRWRKF